MAARSVVRTRVSTVQAEREHPLLLERPSLVSSQTTAHVFSECFSELLGSRDLPWDAKSVSNLALSRTGNRLQHNNRLAEDLKEVSDQYEKKLEVIHELEQHIQQVRAQRLLKEEQKLSSKPNDAGSLLRGTSQSPQFLDKQMLSRHNLLLPRDYLPTASSPALPPGDTVPTYFKSTHTSQQHARVQPVATLCVSPTKVKVSRLPAWKQSMSAEAREAEKLAFSELQRKTNFLPTQRCSSATQGHMASSGPLRMMGKVDASSKKKTSLFVARPSKVVFTDYRPGEAYEGYLEIHNISGATRQLKIVPPSSAFFTATLVHTPHPEGLIAPGMSSRYTVRFKPDSLCDFEDQIKVLSHCGECLTVSLRGCREPPQLNLPEMMDFGYSLINQRRSMVFQCFNSGGEGTFTMTPAKAAAAAVEEEADEEEENEENDGIIDKNTCHLMPFTVSPCTFHLNQQQSVDIQIMFHPKESGLYTRQLLMSCDNGQVKTFTITGVAEPLAVQCVSVSDYRHTTRDGDMCCVSDKDATPNVLPDACDGVVSNGGERLVQFGCTNPAAPVYCTVNINNMSHVELSYQWMLYHPLTELGDAGRVSSHVVLLPEDSAFTVEQQRGILPPQKETTVRFCFNPSEEGSFVCCAYLQLKGIPLASLDPSQEGYGWVSMDEEDEKKEKVAVLCLHLEGAALPYAVQLTPPACVLPGSIPPASVVKQPIQVINHSLHAAHFHWNNIVTGQYTVSVEPIEGTVDPGERYCCDVLVETHSGPCELVEELTCCLDHSQYPLVLPVRGHIEGPCVSVDLPCVDFGLVAVGAACSRSLCVTNRSPANVVVHMTQVVVGRQESVVDYNTATQCVDEWQIPVTDVACLQFDPPVLQLSAHSTAHVTVHLNPLNTPGRLRTAIRCTTTGSSQHCVLAVCGEVQAPLVVLRQCSIHISPAYVGISVQRSVELTNTSLLPTHYKWTGPLQQQQQQQFAQLQLTPSEGHIGPQETVILCLTVTFSTKGSHHSVLSGFTVDGMTAPLLLSVSADVCGLSVEYHVVDQERKEDAEEHTNKSDSLMVDFGDHNSLAQPRSIVVTVHNTSAIPTNCTACVKMFPPSSSPPSTQCALSMPKSQKRSLLGRTANLADPLSKTVQQAEATLSASLLAQGRGACFTVDPHQFDLPPFLSQSVTITAFSDLWGQYSDTLVFSVEGIEEEQVIPIRYGVDGCPIAFPSTATSIHTIVRMGCTIADSDSVKRTLRLSNESCADVCIHWQVYTVHPDDDMVVDLVTTIGDPFTSLSSLPSTSSFPFSVPCESDDDISVETTKQAGDGDGDGHGGDGHGGDGGLVKVYIQPHEGHLSHQPVTINPEHMLVPARGQSAVEVVFTPSVEAYNTLGSSVHCYLLGYLTLKHESPSGCDRKSGYDVPPLRVDVLARIEYPQLSLETEADNNTLTFTCPASSLIEDEVLLDSVVTEHRITLNNTSSTSVQFRVSCHISSFTVRLGNSADNVWHSLRPHQTISGILTACLKKSDIMESEYKCTNHHTSGGSVCLTDTLTAVFSTGVTQEFPIHFTVSLPHLELSKTLLDFGVCLTGGRYNDTVLLYNCSQSGLLWSASVSSGFFSVIPSSGWLPPHLKNGQPSTSHLTLLFTPRAEESYEDTVIITGSPRATGTEPLSITVTGVGTSNENILF